MNDFRSWTDDDGHLHLRAQGPGGTIVSEAWTERGQVIGITAFHSGHPLRGGHQSARCEEHDGPCYLAIAAKDECFRIAEMIVSGQEATAWLALSGWFRILGFGLLPEAVAT